jgi:glycosyltransferase involved in cell wall biosynthesis
MLVHAYYEEDARVRRQAEALVAAGRPVDVFALRRPGQDDRATIDGVEVYRLPVQRHQGAGAARYLAEYLAFATRAGWAVTRAHRHRRYAVLEVHTLPDFLALAGLPVRLRGVPLLLDLHEAMPEFFRIRFAGIANPVTHRLLRAQESMATRLATRILTVNAALRDRLVGLGVPAGKVDVILNTPSTTLFDPRRVAARDFMADGSLRLVYSGALTPVYELDVVLRAVGALCTMRPDLDVGLAIYGRGDAAGPLRALAAELGIEARVQFGGRIPLEDVPAAIAAADIGLAPTRRDRFTEMSLSTKLFEYAAMDKPVIASRLPTVEHYLGGAVTTYESGDPGSLAAAIVGLVDDPQARGASVMAMHARIADLGWDRQAAAYVSIVESIAADGLSSTATLATRHPVDEPAAARDPEES